MTTFLPNKTRVRVVGPRWPLMRGEVAIIVGHKTERDSFGDEVPSYTIKLERGFQNYADISPFDVEPITEACIAPRLTPAR